MPPKYSDFSKIEAEGDCCEGSEVYIICWGEKNKSSIDSGVEDNMGKEEWENARNFYPFPEIM